LGNFGAIGSLTRLALGARAKKKLTLSQQISAIQAADCENTSKRKQFVSAQKMSRLQLLGSVIQIVVNASEVTNNGFNGERVSATAQLRLGDR
jgi:hypothetical protein